MIRVSGLQSSWDSARLQTLRGIVFIPIASRTPLATAGPGMMAADGAAFAKTCGLCGGAAAAAGDNASLTSGSSSSVAGGTCGSFDG